MLFLELAVMLTISISINAMPILFLYKIEISMVAKYLHKAMAQKDHRVAHNLDQPWIGSWLIWVALNNQEPQLIHY